MIDAPRLAIMLVTLSMSRAAPPDFGPNVLIFDPAMPDIQQQIDAVAARQEKSEFGPGRVALLFKPGPYRLDVRMGYYMQVAGLGRSPDDVVVTGAVRSKATVLRWQNATVNFWRSVENLAVTPLEDDQVNIWAASQGTALRRLHVRGDLSLWDGGSASGGFLADCLIDGVVNSGTQQQWLSRNAAWGRWTGSNWNMVFVGVTNPPAGRWPEPRYTVVPATPVSREKPYLFIDDQGQYFVLAPDLAPPDSQGITWAGSPTPGRALSIGQFHIARPETDTAATLNAALNSGQDLLFTPGIYHLEAALRIARPGTVVLGLGYPTLIPGKGTAALTVADVDGVKIGGLILEAGPVESQTLLQVGEPGCNVSHAADPIFLYDLTCRAGGATAGSVRSFATLHSRNVVGDNLWFWRADHGAGAAWNASRVANGLIVNGRDVTIYGLFVEHTQEYQTLWNADDGRVYLYQSELPYDPPDQASWMHDGLRGYASYKVAATVATHEAWGLGVYTVFKNTPVILESALESPAVPGVKFHHMVTYRLNPQTGSGINHIINGRGDEVVVGNSSLLDEW